MLTDNIKQSLCKINPLLQLVIILLLALFTQSMPTYGESINSKPSLIVILLPATNLDDWLSPNHPILRDLLNTGSVALMNTRTARMPETSARESYESAIFTLSSGVRAASPKSFDCLFYNSKQMLPIGINARELYERRLGIQSDSLYNRAISLCPNWQRVKNANQKLGYQIHLGNLADSLQKSGIPVYAIDGFDDISLNNAELFTSNGLGITHVISLSDIVFLSKNGGLFVISLKPENTLDITIKNVKDIVKQIHGRLLVISPYASDLQYYRDDRLTPVAFWGEDVLPGLLWSPSTKHPGLITNTDIAPFIADQLQTSLIYTANGRTLKTLSGKTVATLSSIRSQSLEQRYGQKIMPYIAATLGMWLVYCLFILINRKYVRRRLLLYPLTVILAITVSPSLAAFLSIMGFSIIGLSLAQRVKLAAAMTGMSLAIMCILIIDTIYGGPLLQRTILGYSPIEGARYYGIGNEAMGVLISTTLLVITGLWNRENNKSKASILLFITLIVIILGVCGSKAGGVIVFTGAFIVFLTRIQGRKISITSVINASVLGIIILLALALLDSLRANDSQSHLGATFSLILSHGIKPGIDVVVRKIAIEVHLLYHSAWAFPVWAGWLVFYVIRCRITTNDYHRLSLADAGATAALLSLLFNDAGAVACALCLSIIIARLVFGSIHNETENLYDPESILQTTQ